MNNLFIILYNAKDHIEKLKGLNQTIH